MHMYCMQICSLPQQPAHVHSPAPNFIAMSMSFALATPGKETESHTMSSLQANFSSTEHCSTRASQGEYLHWKSKLARNSPLSSSLTASAMYGTRSLLTMNPGVSLGKERRNAECMRLLYPNSLTLHNHVYQWLTFSAPSHKSQGNLWRPWSDTHYHTSHHWESHSFFHDCPNTLLATRWP